MSGVDPNGGGALVIPGGGGAPLSDATPAALGTAAAGVATSASRADHVHEAPAPSAAGSIGHSWERPSPVTAGPGATFVNTADLAEQVSSGLAASAGVTPTGWMQRLPSGVGSTRCGLTPGQIYVANQDFSAYTIGNLTLAVLFYYSGGLTNGVFALIGGIGNTSSGNRGASVFLRGNGANIDLVAFTGDGSTMVVLQAAVNPSVGLHAVAVAAVTGDVWRSSWDGAAVVDVSMGTTYTAPNGTDALAFVGRSSGSSPMLGQGIDMMVWQSLVSSANMALLTTLPGTPTYELPESASTGAATIRAQACRWDPGSATLPARGLATPLTVTAAAKVAY